MNINLRDIEEIENHYEDLTRWLTSHFCSINACAFILQSIQNAVNNAKQIIKGE